MGCRIGCDLVAVGDVASSIERFGERYLHRLYTPHELAVCGRRPEGLAARFAAKEATIKVLRAPAAALPLTAIEVRREAGGWCSLRLSGAAADWAARARLSEFQVSMSHEGAYAMAVVHCEQSPSGHSVPTHRHAEMAPRTKDEM